MVHVGIRSVLLDGIGLWFPAGGLALRHRGIHLGNGRRMALDPEDLPSQLRLLIGRTVHFVMPLTQIPSVAPLRRDFAAIKTMRVFGSGCGVEGANIPRYVSQKRLDHPCHRECDPARTFAELRHGFGPITGNANAIIYIRNSTEMKKRKGNPNDKESPYR